MAFYIAKRYLFAKKSRNIINVISSIALVSVTIVTAALILLLSVFNGFETLIQNQFSVLSADLQITHENKVFEIDDQQLAQINNIEGVRHTTRILEDNVLFKYKDKQYAGIVKGVDENYLQANHKLSEALVDGELKLSYKDNSQMIMGQGVAYFLSYRLGFVDPIGIYVPNRLAKVGVTSTNSFKRIFLYPSSVVRVEQNFDAKYCILPLEKARELFSFEREISALDIHTTESANLVKIQSALKGLLNNQFTIKSREQQNEIFYKILKTEKWAIYFILTFILLIASFNIVSSLTMLILDKQRDIEVLKTMGATDNMIRRIFMLEGWLISVFGVFIGTFIGSLLAWLQAEFGIIQLNGSGAFIIDAYPVSFKFTDVFLVVITVLIVGWIAASIPVRRMSRKLGMA